MLLKLTESLHVDAEIWYEPGQPYGLEQEPLSPDWGLETLEIVKGNAMLLLHWCEGRNAMQELADLVRKAKKEENE